MKSAQRGRSTSAVELANVSAHGIWLLIAERERFLSFTDFPWFRHATIAELSNVELLSPRHLYWPDLDVDLAVESLDHPERFPLVSRVQPPKRLPPRPPSVKEARATYKTRRKRPRG